MLIAIAALVGMPTNANADPVHNFLWNPDTGQHTWCLGTSFTFDSYAVAAMNQLEHQTAIDAQQACGFNTDVSWRQADEGFYYGMTDCARFYSAGICDAAVVLLDRPVLVSAFSPGATTTLTACHELGHTLGVRHYTGAANSPDAPAQSCMRSGQVMTGWTNYHRYGGDAVSTHFHPWFFG